MIMAACAIAADNPSVPTMLKQIDNWFDSVTDVYNGDIQFFKSWMTAKVIQKKEKPTKTEKKMFDKWNIERRNVHNRLRSD